MSCPETSRTAEAYQLPALLQDIRLLDLLELSGTTADAGCALSVCQPTVSRRYRALADDFALLTRRRQNVGCRYGTNQVMRLLRQACRAHRLAAGVARFGSDVFLQPLLLDQPWQLPSPPRFRCIASWLELVREGVVDGALLSGLELERSGAEALDRSGIALVPLATLEWQLRMAPRWPLGATDGLPTVLVPHDGVAPGLQEGLKSLGLSLQPTGDSLQNPAQWLTRLEHKAVAMVLPRLPPARWWQALRAIELPKPVCTTVWLALPLGWQEEEVLEKAVEGLRGLLGRIQQGERR